MGFFFFLSQPHKANLVASQILHMTKFLSLFYINITSTTAAVEVKGRSLTAGLCRLLCGKKTVTVSRESVLSILGSFLSNVCRRSCACDCLMPGAESRQQHYTRQEGPRSRQKVLTNCYSRTFQKTRNWFEKKFCFSVAVYLFKSAPCDVTKCHTCPHTTTVATQGRSQAL